MNQRSSGSIRKIQYFPCSQAVNQATNLNNIVARSEAQGQSNPSRALMDRKPEHPSNLTRSPAVPEDRVCASSAERRGQPLEIPGYRIAMTGSSTRPIRKVGRSQQSLQQMPARGPFTMPALNINMSG